MNRVWLLTDGPLERTLAVDARLPPIHLVSFCVVPYSHSDITLAAAGERGTRIDMECGHNNCPWDDFAEDFHTWTTATES